MPQTRHGPLKAAIIGLGQIAHEYCLDSKRKGIVTHTQAYLADPRFVLVGAFDPIVSKRRRYQLKWEIPVFDSIESLLMRTKPKVVSICSPYASHLDNLKRILQHDCVKIIFCEKPLAANYKEALMIKKLLKSRKDVSIVLNFSRRFDHAHQEIAKTIAAKGLGKLQCMDGYYGGSFKSNGAHLIDLIEWYGGLIKSVQKIKNPLSDQPHALFTLKSGVPVMIHHLDHKHYLQFELHLFGTKKKISLIQNGFEINTFEPAPSAYFAGIKTLKLKKSKPAYQKTFERALDLICQISKNKKTSHHLLDAAIHNLKIIESLTN